MAVGKNAGSKNMTPNTKWQGAKSTNKNQDHVSRRPGGATAKKSVKKIAY